MAKNRFRHTHYLSSAHELRELPPDRGREAAFVGRSNTGKSSVLNALVEQRALARVSRTPGRTRLINFFAVEDDVRLVDLPGYGYARVPAELQQHWQKTLAPYLEQRRSLRGLVVVLDCRRELTEADAQLLQFAGSIGQPCHLLLNKADKLSPREAQQRLRYIAGAKDGWGASCQLFSVPGNQGVAELRRVLENWLIP